MFGKFASFLVHCASSHDSLQAVSALSFETIVFFFYIQEIKEIRSETNSNH